MINRQFVVDEKMYLETKEIVSLFLQEDLSLIEIATKMDIQIPRVVSKLKNSLTIKKLYPKNYLEIMAKIDEKLAKEEERINNNKHLRLDIFYKDPEKQKKFLIHLALTFRANYETILELFNVYLGNLLTKEEVISSSFKYINIEGNNQEEAKRNILAFYNDCLEAIKNKDKDKLTENIRMIGDYDIKAILSKPHESGTIYGEKDLLSILKYQLKYALSNSQISIIFSVNRNSYADKLQQILEKEENTDLRIRYENLKEFNMYKGDYIRRNG